METTPFISPSETLHFTQNRRGSLSEDASCLFVPPSSSDTCSGRSGGGGRTLFSRGRLRPADGIINPAEETQERRQAWRGRTAGLKVVICYSTRPEVRLLL